MVTVELSVEHCPDRPPSECDYIRARFRGDLVKIARASVDFGGTVLRAKSWGGVLRARWLMKSRAEFEEFEFAMCVWSTQEGRYVNYE